ncbi:MAG: hypothetical protein FIB04_07100 [Gammaproteobacteria bacterium]|nr:hypothetical protein [Gammaproteobacteria bacterium]
MKSILGALCALLIVQPALAEPAPVQVMVLGTWHLGNPGQDLHNVAADDVLKARRQDELARAIGALAAFRPTVVAVERVTTAPAYEDARYPSFTAEQLGIDRDERVQVGYRLAHVAGLEKVYGIDEQPTNGEPDYFPFEKLQASVSARGQEAALGELMADADRKVQGFEQRKASRTMTV